MSKPSPSSLKNYIKQRSYLLLAVGCSFVFFVLGVITLRQSPHLDKSKGVAITYDEVSLLPNGYNYQTGGTYFLNPEHPPLVKDIAALPFYYLKPNLPNDQLPKKVLFEDYAQYAWGKTFLFESGNNPEQLIFWARAFVLLANAGLVFVLFLSLSKAWSKRAGLIATFLITTSQFVLGHGMLVTLDVMSALLTTLSLVWFSVWLKQSKDGKPTTKPLVLTSVFLAGALTAKFSTILLLPVLVLLAIGYGVLARKKLAKHWKRHVISLIGLFSLTLMLIIVFYAYHVRHMAGADIITQLHKSYHTDRLPKFGLNLLSSLTHFGIFGRALAEFVNGILMVNNRIYNGAGGVYFMNHYYGVEGAGPLYFPALYLTKLQPLYHVLSLAAIASVAWAAWKNKARSLAKSIVQKPLPYVLAAYATVFAAIALSSTLQIGLRHIFPVIISAMVLTALGLDGLITRWQKSKRYAMFLPGSVAVVALVMLTSTFSSFPYYLSYYNFIAGGTNNGYKLATDSNYDWGQDLKALGAWKQQNHVDKLYLDIFTNPFLPLEYYLGNGNVHYDISKDAALPAGSYFAVSIHQYEINTHRNLPAKQDYSQFANYQVGRVGKTILIFKIPVRGTK